MSEKNLIEEAKSNPQKSAEAALAMKLSGASEHQICEVLGYTSPAKVIEAISNMLAKSSLVNNLTKSQMQAFMYQRYESLLKSVMPDAINPKSAKHLNANRRAQEIMDRQVVLLGLQEPARVQVETVSDQRLVEIANAFKEARGLEPSREVIEGDIFARTPLMEEAEIVEVEDD
mgnify:CR=1 FL=1